MRSALNQVNTPLCGRKQKFFPNTKRKATNLKRNTVRYQYYQFVVSCLRSLYLMKYMTTLVKNDLLTSTQSGFRPGDSTINQLLSIYTAYILLLRNSHLEKRVLFFLIHLKVGSHDPVLVQLSLKSFLCMMENVGIHKIQFSHPIIS